MTEVSLREYIERLLDERQKQVDLAASELRTRLEAMNEFRQQIDRERALYVRSDQLEAWHERIGKLEKWQSEVMGRQVVFGFAVIVLAGVVSLAMRLVGH